MATNYIYVSPEGTEYIALPGGAWNDVPPYIWQRAASQGWTRKLVNQDFVSPLVETQQNTDGDDNPIPGDYTLTMTDVLGTSSIRVKSPLAVVSNNTDGDDNPIPGDYTISFDDIGSMEDADESSSLSGSEDGHSGKSFRVKSPVVNSSQVAAGEYRLLVDDIEGTSELAHVKSPVVTVGGTGIDGETLITIEDISGTSSVVLKSPVVEVSDNDQPGNHTLLITDAAGTKSVILKDGIADVAVTVNEDVPGEHEVTFSSGEHSKSVVLRDGEPAPVFVEVVSSTDASLTIEPGHDYAWVVPSGAIGISATGGHAGYNCSQLLDITLLDAEPTFGANIMLGANETLATGMTNRCLAVWRGTTVTLYVYEYK